MVYQVDFYHLPESKIKNQIEKIIDPLQIKLTRFELFQKRKKNRAGQHILLFEENDSYMNSAELFEKVKGDYFIQPVVIILSFNKEIINVVRWMRNGAHDYLWSGDLTRDIFINSIKGALDYARPNNEFLQTKQVTRTDFYRQRIKKPHQIDWEVLKNDENYELGLVYLQLNIDQTSVGRYSEASLFKIFQRLKGEIETVARRFGGKIWFWQNNAAVITFFFGQKINCSVLFGIAFFHQFFLICIEKMQLDEILNFKIVIHNGKGIYHKTNTELITCDLINTLIHIANQYAEENTFLLTEEVFNHLSVRIKSYFNRASDFEKRKIFQFNL